MKFPIYLDCHATTPLDPEVLEAMMPYLTDLFGNSASTTHVFGWMAEEAVQRARTQVAQLIHASPEEIIFTSGATESDNFAIKGVAYAYRDKGNHIVTTQAEHKAVLNSCKVLEKQGFEVTYLPVDRYGMVDPEAVRKAITDRTILISIMYANNEVGTINPIWKIGEIARERGILFHSDAVQGIGKIESDVGKLNVDLMSISAHKMYGPKGIGALYIRKIDGKLLQLTPLIEGGGHEWGIRSGTPNVPGIVGFGQACEVCQRVWKEEGKRLKALRDRLYQGIVSQLEEVTLNGHPEERLPGNLNLSFAWVDGTALLGLKNIAVSAGSACTSGKMESSYVLVAMGVDEPLTMRAIRFGLGRFHTEEEIDYVVKAVVEHVNRLREMSSQYVETQRRRSELKAATA